jgi:hypothetical protein
MQRFLTGFLPGFSGRHPGETMEGARLGESSAHHPAWRLFRFLRFFRFFRRHKRMQF